MAVSGLAGRGEVGNGRHGTVWSSRDRWDLARSGKVWQVRLGLLRLCMVRRIADG